MIEEMVRTCADDEIYDGDCDDPACHEPVPSADWLVKVVDTPGGKSVICRYARKSEQGLYTVYN